MEQLSLFPVEDDYFLTSAEPSSDVRNVSLSVSQTLTSKEIESDSDRSDSDSNKNVSLSINRYSPAKRKTEYFRLSYRDGAKMRHIHIRGGNVNSLLAQNRVRLLQNAINSGAKLPEIIAMCRNL